MSRLAKKGIAIPAGVEVKLEGSTISVKGPKGELRRDFRAEVKFVLDGGIIRLEPQGDSKLVRSLVGTYAAIIKNMIAGVSAGFEKSLVIEGTGYRFQVAGKELSVSAGFTAPVKVQIPEGLQLKVEKTELSISGLDKELVGDFAAKVRGIRPPEPYKGKGVRYADEIIRRKQGKKAVTAAV